MKYQGNNALATSAGIWPAVISDNRLPNFLKSKKIHVPFCRQIHCNAVTLYQLFRDKTGFPESLTPWWASVSCYVTLWKAKSTGSHATQSADLSDALFFQVQAIASYDFFFTGCQTIHLLTGVNNTHWKEKQERGRDPAWKKNHQFSFQMQLNGRVEREQIND